MAQYIICVPLSGGTEWFQLCVCQTPEATSEIVRSLLRADKSAPTEIKIIVEKHLQTERD